MQGCRPSAGQEIVPQRATQPEVMKTWLLSPNPAIRQPIPSVMLGTRMNALS